MNLIMYVAAAINAGLATWVGNDASPLNIAAAVFCFGTALHGSIRDARR